MSERLEVGKRYPLDIPFGTQGAFYTFDASGHTLRLLYPGARGDEVRDVRKGDAHFAVVYEEPAIFLLYKFGSQPWGDAPFTIHMVPEDRRRTEMFDPAQGGVVNALQVHLVDTRSGITKALKMYGLPVEFVLAIKDKITKQLAAGWKGREDYDAGLDVVCGRYSTEALLARADQVAVFHRQGL